MKTPAPAPHPSPALRGLENPFLGGCSPLLPAWVEETRAWLLRPLPPPASWLSALVHAPSLAPAPVPMMGLKPAPISAPAFGAEEGALAPSKESELPWWVGEAPEPSGSLPQYTLMEPLAEPSLEPLGQGDPSTKQVPGTGPAQHLRDLKLTLVYMTCSSLVEGMGCGDLEYLCRMRLENLCEELAQLEPEFILKVALYARQELNIRSTANFLLALAARLPPCRPHLRRYLCATVQLPSDWTEVVARFQVLADAEHVLGPLPRCLRVALADKFRQFDAYQLAKYNSRKSRGKSGRPPQRRQRGQGPRNPALGPQPQQPIQGASLPPGAAPQHPAPWTRRARLRETFSKLQAEFASGQPAPQPRKNPFSLKALIRWLHISEPAEHVMSLLGRRYPSDLSSFSRSHLPGPWDPSRAGTRMKLPQPKTWDRQLSQRGNKAGIWEELIDSGKLPFMAMLRNLRSIIQAGVSELHHQRVLNRLQSKESIVRSRQFPFRFLAASKVIQGMEEQLKKRDGPLPSNVELLRALLRRRKMPPKVNGWRVWTRRELRVALSIPVLFRMVKAEKLRLQKARELHSTPTLLLRYRQALDAAVRIAARHNLPPLPGRTVILCCAEDAMMMRYQQGRKLVGTRETPMTLLEVALLLGLMCRTVAEQARLVLYGRGNWEEVPVLGGSLLENVQNVYQQIQATKEPSGQSSTVTDVLWGLLARGEPVDAMLVLSRHSEIIHAERALQLLRDRVAPQSLFVNLSLHSNSVSVGCVDTVGLAGFSEQVLRFMASCGASHLLEHVDRMDEIHGLPPPSGGSPRHRELPSTPIILSPTSWSRWCSLRIFISSPVRDMQGERDVLVRAVLPALRARAAPHCLALQEIDLRWGITEQEARQDRQLELCLSEVARSQLFVGILGERYGYVPREYTLPDAPPYEWVKSYPRGRSITELEAMQFLSSQQESGSAARAFFYFREPDFLGSVPEAWQADFVAESKDAQRRMADLKGCLGRHPGVASVSRYSCQWGGVAQGRPYVKGLEEFGARVLEDLWGALQRQFLQAKPVPPGSEEEEEGQELQNAFQDFQQRQFCARAKLLGGLAARVLEGRPPRRRAGGSLYLVTGEPGNGKTVFMAALAQELSTHSPAQDKSPCLVISHFTGAGPGQASARVVLSQVCSRLSHLLGQPALPPSSYRDLVSRLQSLLSAVAGTLRGAQRLAVLLDGADQIHGDSGHLVSDWLPPHLPPRISLVLSIAEDTGLLGSLQRRADAVTIQLGPLDPADRAMLIRRDLALYGKKLEESAFNNQMRLVLLKRGARQPLYLALLAQDLRTFTLYEKVSERIQTLPPSLPALLQHLLGCLEQEHGSEPVAMAMATLWASKDGLLERDLLALLSIWRELAGTSVTWEGAVAAGSRAATVPKAHIYALIRSLRELAGVCGVPLQTPGSRLHLSGTPLRTAVKRRYLARPDQEQAAHILMAAHLWRLCDPDDSWSFRGGEIGPLVELPHHLICARRPDLLASLLTNLRFVAAHVHLRLLPALAHAYALHASCAEPSGEVSAFRAMLQAGRALLAHSPHLLAQLAANAPDGSSLGAQAQALAQPGRRLLLWRNKTQESPHPDSITLALPTSPACVAVSLCGRQAAVGSTDGTLHLLDARSGQELKTLLSSGAGISACVFLADETLCLGTMVGGLEMWGLREGSRLLATEAHQGRVTGCCVSPDRQQLVTISLDGYLKLWDPARGQLSWAQDLCCSLNCADIHPDGQLVATGGWDGVITVLDLHSQSVKLVLSGHDSSIRAVAFAPTGSVLASGCLAGTVCLWSWQEATILATFSAHQGFVSQIKFLSGGQTLLTAGEDSKVQLWPGHLGCARGTLGSGPLSPALCVAPNPAGSLIAVGHHSDNVWVYSHPWGSTGRHCPGVGLPVHSLAWLGDAVLVGGAGNGSLHGWVLAKGLARPLWELRAHEGAVLGLAASHQLLASASEDFTICLWPAEMLQRALPDPPLAPLAVLRGHAAAVTCCAFSHDGQHLATGGRDKTLLCWAVGDLAPGISPLWHSLPSCHRDWVSGCAWIGPLLLSCSIDGTVRLWDPASGQRLREFLAGCGPVSSVLVMTGHLVAFGRDGTLAAWDMQGVEITHFSAHPGLVNQGAGFMESDGDLVVAVAGSDGQARLWSPLVLGRPQVLVGHGAPVCGAAVNPASSRLLTVSGDGAVHFWAPPWPAGSTEGSCWHRGAVSALAWDPDGQLAVTGGACGELIAWREAKALAMAQASPHCISALIFASPRSLLVVSAAKSIWLWSLRGDPCPRVLSLERDRSLGEVSAPVTCVGQTGTLGSLVLGLANGNMLLFEPHLETLQPICLDSWVPERSEFLSETAVTPDGHLLLWKDKTAPILCELTLEESEESESQEPKEYQENWIRRRYWDEDADTLQFSCAQLSPDSSLFLACSDGSLRIRDQWSKEDDESDSWSSERWQYQQIHSAKVTALHVCGDTLVTAALDGDVKIWDCATRKLLGQFRCTAPISCLKPQPSPANKLHLAIGDTLGNVYFLDWACLPGPE